MSRAEMSASAAGQFVNTAREKRLAEKNGISAVIKRYKKEMLAELEEIGMDLEGNAHFFARYKEKGHIGGMRPANAK